MWCEAHDECDKQCRLYATASVQYATWLHPMCLQRVYTISLADMGTMSTSRTFGNSLRSCTPGISTVGSSSLA